MSIQQKIKAFWWFQEQKIGGMARPGFNRLHWSKLSLQEAAVFNWLGQHLYDQPDLPLTELWSYLDQLAPKVAPFYHLSTQEVRDAFAPLHDLNVLSDLIDRLNRQTQLLEPGFVLEDGPSPQLNGTFCHQQMHHELQLLQEHGISTLISLMGTPPNAQVLDSDLNVYHFPVQDLTPPTYDQVESFATLLKKQSSQHGVAVHCFAGVGRTTTMLVAAHLLYGESLEELTQRIEANNPHYQRKGSQWKFVCELAEQVGTPEYPSLVNPL